MQGNYIEDYFLIGGIAVVGLAEVAHLGAMFTGQSFSGCVMLFGIMLMLFTLGCIIFAGAYIGRKKKKNRVSDAEIEDLQKFKKQEKEATGCKDKWLIGVRVLFLLLIMLQVILICVKEEVYIGGDLTAEMVESLLSTDAFYQVNPLTGQAYISGVPTRLKILCLPTLYAILCDVLHMSPEVVIWKILPTIVLLGSYLAYRILARVFWANNAFARSIFMIIVALCFLLGDYMYGVDGFGVMHAGYRGVAIRAAILLPYTFGLCLRKKWLVAVLCILAEACMMWTFYGIGACFLVIIGMYLVTKMLSFKNEEGLRCKNS